MNSTQISSQNPYKFEYSIPYFLDDRWGRKLHVSERSRKCVVFLGVLDDEGNFNPKGTGFVVSCEEYGSKWLHLVTAQHVIVAIQELSHDVAIRYNLIGGGIGGSLASISDWYYHPDAENSVDVAVIPFDSSAGIDYSYIPMESDFVTQEVVDNLKMDTGDDIFVTGLFSSHYGRGKNVPIVRTGTIAAMLEEPVYTGTGYIDAYLIEGRSIGGLSGSPVFFQPAPLRMIDGVVTPTENSKAHYLLGLIHGHFDVKEIIDIVEDEAEYAKTNKLHSGIAIVVPSEKIVETINQDMLKKMREETAKKAMAGSDTVPDVASVEEESENPSHKEDFIRLLGEAVSSPPTDD